MKTVWNVLSENQLTDHPTIQSFTNKDDARDMIQELFKAYCEEFDLDPSDPDLLQVENIGDTRLYVFVGGEYEEWAYLMESELTPPTAHTGVLMTDEDL